MDVNDVDREFQALPLETKEFLLRLIDKRGPHPMGESLALARPIYKILYEKYGNMKMFFVGQSRVLGAGDDARKVTICAIHYDWIRSEKVDTYAIMAKREDGVVVLFESITAEKPDLTYDIR